MDGLGKVYLEDQVYHKPATEPGRAVRMQKSSHSCTV